jgi:MraZ protein
MVYTSETFDKVSQKAAALSATDPGARDVKRVIFGRAGEVSLDSSGRILLPDFLREYAGIDSEAFVVGAGEYFEIWQAERWIQQEQSVTDSDANAQRFADYDLSTG